MLCTATPDVSSLSKNINSTARVARLSFRFLWLRPSQATTEMRIGFLTEYFKTGVRFGSVNSTSSGLSSIMKHISNLPSGKFADFLKEFLILDPSCQEMLQL